MHCDPKLRRRFDTSDVIQDALLKAHANRAQFRGTTDTELLAWLRQILTTTYLDLAQAGYAGKRDVRREVQEAINASSQCLDDFLADDASSPVEQAIRRERLLRLAAALEQLDEDQREVFFLRGLRDLSVEEIAEQLGKTLKSVAGLYFRARLRLTKLLREPDSTS
jgi:RNA polymerase sigma-70 factor (ECF subfamily)